MKRPLTIRTQLLILALGVALPLLGLVGYLAAERPRQAIEDVRAHCLRLAQLAAADLQHYLRDADAMLGNLSRQPLVQALGPGCSPVFETFAAEHPGFGNLMLVDSSLSVRCAAVGWVSGPLHPEAVESTRRALRTGRPAISRPFHGLRSRKWVVALVRPIEDREGHAVGVIGTSIDLVRYQMALARVALPRHGTLCILDREGTVVARFPDGRRWVGRSALGTEIADFALTRNEGFAEARGLDRVRRIYAFTTVPEVGWTVSVGIPKAAALAVHRNRTAGMIVVSVALLALAAASALFLSAGIARPIQALSRATAGSSHGRTTLWGAAGTSAEIAALDQRLNETLEARDRAEADRDQLLIQERQIRLEAHTAEGAIRELLGRITDGFAAFDRDLRYTYVSPRAAAILGRPREELLQRRWSEVLPDAAGGPIENALARALAEQVPLEIEARGGGPDAWLETRIFPSPDGLTVFFRDTSERHQTRSALEHSAARLRLAMQAAEVGLWDWDLRTRQVYYSPEWRSQLGESAEIGASIEEFLGRVHPEDQARLRTDLADYLGREPRGTFQAEVRMRHADGQGRWMLIRAEALREGGRPHRVLGCQVDVTHLKEREETERRMQDRLRRAELMSAMGSLVAGVAHEVRNPLFAITATVDALEARLGSEGHAPYVSALRGQTSRLARLMQDLLEYGRPYELRRAPVPAHALVQDARHLCEDLAVERQVAIEVHLEAPDARAYVDRDRVALALRNLLENALHHSPPGARTVVEARAREEQGRRWVAFEVRDQGGGFREEDLPKIFEPFFTRRSGGTGLGLSIVQRIAQEHGGEIRLSNAPQGGGVATLLLPPAPEESVSAEEGGTETHVPGKGVFC